LKSNNVATKDSTVYGTQERAQLISRAMKTLCDAIGVLAANRW